MADKRAIGDRIGKLSNKINGMRRAATDSDDHYVYAMAL